MLVIVKKYWVPITLFVIFISSYVITQYTPLEWMCNTNSAEYASHGFCTYDNGPLGWLAAVPFFSIFGLVVWFLTYSIIWLMDSFKKRKNLSKVKRR